MQVTTVSGSDFSARYTFKSNIKVVGRALRTSCSQVLPLHALWVQGTSWAHATSAHIHSMSIKPSISERRLWKNIWSLSNLHTQTYTNTHANTHTYTHLISNWWAFHLQYCWSCWQRWVDSHWRTSLWCACLLLLPVQSSLWKDSNNDESN